VSFSDRYHRVLGWQTQILRGLHKGGYGTTRLSDIVGFDASVLNTLSTSPRWLIGYSDVTALHALWNRAGVLSMHGPMGVDINSWSSNARSRLFEVLGGTGPIVQSYSGTIRYAGTPTTNVTGRLLGGNLSVLGSMVGSGYLPSYAGAILLIEDTDEAACESYSNLDHLFEDHDSQNRHADSVDRLLTQLLRAAEFQGIVGIAIGQLIGADTSSYTALELLDRTLSPLGIPVITGLSIGHTASTSLPIVLGAAAEINVALGKLVVSVP